jgi:hypothetical protein
MYGDRLRKAALLGVVVLVATLVPAARAVAQPATGASGDADHVRSVHNNGDGTVTVAMWTPAPGVSAAALYADLKKRGTSGLVDPSASADQVQAADADCSIQGAYALQRLCGTQRIHWAGSHPVVYYVDHTGPQWPVYSAVFVWNESFAIDVGYRNNSAGCPSSSANCVHVYNADYGATKWAGLTSYSYGTTSRVFTAGSVVVKFNDYYYYNSSGLQQNACHELGHGLGLDHNISGTSCMWYAITNTTATRYPADGDYLMLESIY